MIKAVVFDIDNTLYSYDDAHAVAFEALLHYSDEQLGMNPAVFREEYRKAMENQAAAMGNVAALHNRIIRFQHILEKRGLPLYPHVLEMYSLYWDTLLGAAVPSVGALETMKELRTEGICIGIGTDMTSRMQFMKLTSLGLLSYIDFFVSSEEACAEKPASQFFECVIKKAGCIPQECLFVGDNLKKDVLGATSAGLRGVWYCPAGNDGRSDVLQITELPQLRQLISEL